MKTGPIPFTPELVSSNAKIVGGFASSGCIDPSAYADDVFGGEVSGSLLCCYMMRRFGWPNSGGDSYKDLCTWTITTPMRGLYLSVTPYLGGSNLHFAVRYDARVGRMINADPGRKSYQIRWAAALGRWWGRIGRHKYAFGCGVKEGDEDTLVHLYAEDRKDPNKVWGLWQRTPKNRHIGNRFPKDGMALWWLGRYLEEKHPEVKLPKMTKRERNSRTSRDQLRIIAALTTTMRDMLRPTNVRDISFSPLGDMERNENAAKASAKCEAVGYFRGSGYSAEYWFGMSSRKRNSILRGKDGS